MVSGLQAVGFKLSSLSLTTDRDHLLHCVLEQNTPLWYNMQFQKISMYSLKGLEYFLGAKGSVRPKNLKNRTCTMLHWNFQRSEGS